MGDVADRPLTITAMRPDDWERVAEIYAQGIATGDSTFETEVPAWERWDADHLPQARVVARLGDVIVGWAAASRISVREVYEGVAECSVYVADEARHDGVGAPLLQTLIAASEEAGIWTLEAVIFVENAASRRMVESCGFRLVGRRERLGRLGDRWRDVYLMERRRAG